jgi:hypothetical protein
MPWIAASASMSAVGEETLDRTGEVCKPPAVVKWSIPIGGCATRAAAGASRRST